MSLDKARFIGQAALAAESRRGPGPADRGPGDRLAAVEKIFERAGLAPQVPAAASRVAVPVFPSGGQVGKATSTTWSPTLKKLIALATTRPRQHTAPGSVLEFELTVEAVRHRVPATVVETPFFNPKRKTAPVGVG